MYGMEYRIEVGEMAPDLQLPATNGKTIRLYDYRIKISCYSSSSTTTANGAWTG